MTQPKSKCKTCGRLVGGGQPGMSQHRNAKHSANSTNNPPRNQPRRNRSTNAPVAKSVKLSNAPPRMTSESGGTRIRHTEAVPIVRPAKTGTANGVVNVYCRYRVGDQVTNNPALPWLAGISSNFDQITYHSMSAEWVPLVGTSHGGDVILGWDPSAADKAPSDFASAYVQGVNSRCALWDSTKVVAPANDLKILPKYETTMSMETEQANYKTPGHFTVFLTDTDVTDPESAQAQTLGRLVLSYDVTLSRPEQPDRPATSYAVGSTPQA